MTTGASSPESPTPDATMEAIAAAVTRGQTGDVAGARSDLEAIWRQIGVTGDALHRCTLAHHLADLCDGPAVALAWDVRALDAADALTDERAQAHHAGLDVAAFYPSLHLNLADDYRRLGAFDAAADHLRRADENVHRLDEGPYGDLVRGALAEVARAVADRDTTPRTASLR